METIKIPEGYASIEDYLTVLRLNLLLARGPDYLGSKNPSKRAFGAKIEARIVADIADIEEYLAKS